MENKQINFFKAIEFNTVLKPFKKGTVVKIENLEAREWQKELKVLRLMSVFKSVHLLATQIKQD